MENKEAIRLNHNKPELSIVDLDSLMDTADVFVFGAQKYERDNWKLGQHDTKILDSMLRHIAAIMRGEFVDPESGLPHHGHIGCNAIFLANTYRNHPDKIEMVDRDEVEDYYVARKHIPNKHNSQEQ